MTREEAIVIIENEKKCVNRANKNDYCNRDCYNCELVKTDTEILTALDMAIRALKNEQSENVGICQQNVGEMSEKQTDRVSKSVVDQIKWERDVAIDQLENLGYELGEKPGTDGDLISRQAVNKLRKYNLVGGIHTVNVADIEKLPTIPQPALSEVDFIELRHRYGESVEKTVRRMCGKESEEEE